MPNSVKRDTGPGATALFFVSMELKEFFRHRRRLHFVPLILFGIFLVDWVYHIAPTFLPVVVVVFGGLEPQYNNIFFRSPRELESLVVLSVDWRRVVILKNVATLILTAVAFAAVTATLFFFSPEVYFLRSLKEAVLFSSTIVFPLLHIGNIRSVHEARRDSGWETNDFIELLYMLGAILLAGIPYYLFVVVFKMPALCIFYAIATAIYWFRVTVPRAVREIIENQTVICSRT